MIAHGYCTPERTAYFIEVVRAISDARLNPGFGRVTEADADGFTISLTIFNSHVERFAKAKPDLVEEERQRLASCDTLPKGQDAKQGLAGTEGSAVGSEASETPNSPPSDLSTDKDG